MPCASIGTLNLTTPIERRHLFEQFSLLIPREMSPADLVYEVRTARVHHQGARFRQRVLEGEMNLVGPARDGTDGADGGVQHDCVATSDAESSKILR